DPIGHAADERAPVERVAESLSIRVELAPGTAQSYRFRAFGRTDGQDVLGGRRRVERTAFETAVAIGVRAVVSGGEENDGIGVLAQKEVGFVTVVGVRAMRGIAPTVDVDARAALARLPEELTQIERPAAEIEAA